MLELFGLPLGTAFQGGTLLTAIIIALGFYFKHAPDRRRAENERKQIDATEMEKVLADYGQQIVAFRDEVHSYRNEVQALQGELWASEKTSSQRNDRISTMETIIELLIAELEQANPNSPAVRQAKIMMRRISGGDPAKSDALNSAEHTARDTKQADISANAAVEMVKAAEEGK